MTVWDDVALLPGPPPGDGGPGHRDVVHERDGLRLIELDDSGWGALVGWAFGATAMRRFVDDRVRMTTIVCERAGVRTVQVRPWTDEEWAEYRDDIDSYLAEGGAPPRPVGYVWYLVLPPGCTPQAIWAAMDDQQRIAVQPAQLAPLLRAAATRFARPEVRVA